MIGLGSNRLTVCRRGGMSVTQAGRGGMEWLAGFRAPSWSSPYSAQATAALKAQFPTQWPTIRDYGFAHPEIVGYMNAYAPEDAKIAYSLVEGIGTRWITGNGSWFKLPVIITSSNCNTLQIRAKVNTITTGGWRVNGKGGGACRYFGIGQNNTFAYGNNSDIQTSTSAASYIGKMLEYELDFQNGKFIVKDGDTIVHQNTFTASSVSGSNPQSLFAWNNGSGAGNIFNAATEFAEYGFGGTLAYKFVPFNDNGTACLLDIISGEKNYKLGSGTPTISETPAS